MFPPFPPFPVKKIYTIYTIIKKRKIFSLFSLFLLLYIYNIFTSKSGNLGTVPQTRWCCKISSVPLRRKLIGKIPTFMGNF